MSTVPDFRLGKLAPFHYFQNDHSPQGWARTIADLERVGLIVLDPDDPEVIERVAEALAKDGSDQFVEISGHGRAWVDFDPDIRARCIAAQTRTARAVLSALKADG